jgi:hypothetical protein
MLLYVGGLLVVAAGLIYASYSWSTMGPWQKLGLLFAATIAFIVIGSVLLRHERVRQAGETYIAIGAMLVPTNGIAAYTVLDGAQARPELPLLFAAIATSITHGAFSIRPAGRLYDYSAMLAGALAIGTLPAAFGAHPAWGTPALLLGVALIPAPTGRLAHLRQAFAHVSTVVGTGAGLLLVAATSGAWADTDPWLLPSTFATLALALARFDRAWTRHDGTLAGLASVAVTGAVASSLWAWHIENLSAMAVIALLLAAIYTAAIVYGPDLFRRPVLRGAMTAQVILGAWLPIFLLLADDRAWGVSLACLTGLALTGLITASWQVRWLLFFPSLHLLALYFSTLGFIDTGEWLNEDIARFMIAPPIIIAAFAWALDRSGRDFPQPMRRLGLPSWLMAALLGIITLFFGFPYDERLSSESYRFAITLGLLALTTLVAAWSLQAPIIRYLYGALGVVAIGTALEPVDLAVLDLFLVFLAGCALISIPSVPAVATALGKHARFLRPFAHPAPPHELKIFGVTMAAFLSLMLATTGAYIATGAANEATSLDASGMTWPLYLITFAALTGAGVFAGWRISPSLARPQLAIVLVTWTIGWSLVTVALATRMLTVDLVIWGWVAMAIGTGMVIASLPGHDTHPFLRSLVATGSVVGMVVGYVGLAGNIGLAFSDRPEHDAGQVVFFIVVAVAMIGGTRVKPLASVLYHSVAALGLANPFAMRALAGDLQDTSISFTAFAWLLVGTGAIASRVEHHAWRRPHLVNSALTANAVAIGLAVPDAVRWADATRADIVNAVAWASLVALLAIEGTRTIDGRRTLLAMLAGIATVMAIVAAFDGDRFAMSLALLVYGWLAAGTLIAAQRLQHAAWPTRHGTETGILANTIALGIPVLALTGEMRQAADPALVLGLVSMAGLVGVDAYLHRDRLRVVLATVFGMAALLYQIDTSQPSDIHAYTVPLAVYLLALGYLFRRHPVIEQPLMAIGAGTLAVPTLLMALDEETFRWLLIAGAEGFALFFGGLLTRLRVPIAAGILTITVIVLRMVVDAVNALPSWVTLLLAGIALLIIGTLWLVYRDPLKERLGDARERWAHLG